MPFDGLFLAAIKNELKENLLQGRIDKIHQPDKMELALVISRPGSRRRLVINANARDARIHLSEGSRENPLSPPLFCMVLRKHLESARIEDIIQPGLERVLELRLTTRDELGRPGNKSLIIEIMGKHSNIILMDQATGMIIDGIKRYSHAVSRHREVLPGREYVAPPEQAKHNPLDLSEEQFRHILMNEPLDATLKDILQRRLAGFSKAVCLEVLFRSQLPRHQVLDRCGDYELRLLWEALQSITQPCRRENFTPTVILDAGGKPLDFAAIDLTMFEGHQRSTNTASKVAESFFDSRRLTEKISGFQHSLLASTTKNIKRLTKKLVIQKEDLDRAKDADIYRLYGELLQANLYQLDQSCSEAVLNNFYDPEGPKVTIPLDPYVTPGRNAQAYFKKYLKAKKTRQAALEQIDQNTNELVYLQEVTTAIEMATDMSTLEEIRLELVDQNYLTAGPAAKKGKPAVKAKASQPLSFLSSDGFTILVGKNNRQNDRLTMKQAGPEDVWLHTKEIPGSHVVIRTEDRPVPPSTLAEAASLAAHFSQARQSKNVPVDYTLRKHVSKPTGARPGYVIYRNQKTLTANPDPELAIRLAGHKED